MAKKKMTLAHWSKLDLFTGIDIFIDWCREHNLDHQDPEVFEQFKKELKEAA